MNIQQSLRATSTADRLVAGGSAAVLIGLSLPWFGVSSTNGTLSVNLASTSGFYGWGWLTFVALLGMCAIWAMRHFAQGAVELPDRVPPDAMLFLLAGVVEVLGVVLFWLVMRSSSVTINTPGGGLSAGLSVGWFVALAGAALTLAGGSTKRSEAVTAV